LRVRSSAPVVESHTLAVPSLQPVTIRAPSELHELLADAEARWNGRDRGESSSCGCQITTEGEQGCPV
jgi:hypothetical protein